MKSRSKFLIAFIGIDGAGKSTVTEKLQIILKEKGEECEIVYMGLGKHKQYRSKFLSSAIKLYSKLKYSNKKKSRHNNAVKKKERRITRNNYRKRSFFWVLIQYSEFWLRYLHAKKNIKAKHILFDRYFYDGLILSGNRFTYHFFKWFTPKPDLSICLKAPVEVIRERKLEASEDNIINFYSSVENLKDHFPIYTIDTRQSIQQTTNQILKLLNAEYNDS